MKWCWKSKKKKKSELIGSIAEVIASDIAQAKSERDKLVELNNQKRMPKAYLITSGLVELFELLDKSNDSSAAKFALWTKICEKIPEIRGVSYSAVVHPLGPLFGLMLVERGEDVMALKFTSREQDLQIAASAEPR